MHLKNDRPSSPFKFNPNYFDHGEFQEVARREWKRYDAELGEPTCYQLACASNVIKGVVS